MSSDTNVYQLQHEDDGVIHASRDTRCITIIPQDGEESKAFHRNGIKLEPGGERRTRWFVAELDGVRLYVNGDSIIMTKKDMYP